MTQGKRFPRGQIRADDEGVLRMAVAHRDGTLIVDFGKPVVWFGLGIAEAEGLIALMQKHVDEMKTEAA